MKFHLSLRTQLIIMILQVTLCSATLAFTFSIIYDFVNLRKDLKNDMRFTAQLMADNAKSPLLFNDELGANELLQSFRSIPMVIGAGIIDTNGNLFASYIKFDFKDNEGLFTGTSDDEKIYYKKNYLNISIPVKHESRQFGTLKVRVSTFAIQQKLFISAGIYLLILMLIMAGSYFTSLKLHLLISGPVLELKRIAEKITNDSDYTVRVAQTYHNEIGQLQKSFNLMVQQLDKNVTSLKNEIIDHKRSQHETMQLRVYLKNIIDSLSSIIIAVDIYGMIKQVNTAAEKFIGDNSDSLIHRPVGEVVILLKDKLNHLKNCMDKCEPQTFSVIYYKKGIAQQNYLNVGMFPLAQEDNQGIVIVIDDITEKNRMESMMIQNEKMISLGGLAAGMAHEINNPLGIISQGVQNVMRHLSVDQPRNREIASECNVDLVSINSYLEKRKIIYYLDGIHSASKRASEIVANMLQFSRMSNQSKTPANINEIVDQTIELAQNEYELKKKFDFRQIKMVKEYQNMIPLVFCNVTEIQQVILNLLKNAAHALFDKKGPDFIPQIITRTSCDNSIVKIEIEDNGPGISDEIKKKIFEPFFTTKEVGVGTGLGLSVSFFIITKIHGGTIDFESSVGNGTKFIIRLPNKQNA